MAQINAVIDEYFRDPDIEDSRKDALAKGLDDGSIELKTAVQAIAEKYPQVVRRAAINFAKRTAGNIINKTVIEPNLRVLDSIKPAPPGPLETAGNIAKGVTEMGISGVNEFGRAMGNAAQTTGQLIDTAANIPNYITGNKPISPATAVGSYIKSGYDQLANINEGAMTNTGLNPQSGASTAGKIGGNVAATIATGAAIGTPKVNIPNHPTLSNVVSSALTSPISTSVSTATTEGRMPTPAEFGAYGALDMLFSLGGMLGSKVYKSAFKGTKGAERNLVHNYGTTVGGIAEDLGYSGTAKQIRSKAKDSMVKLWDQMDEIGKNASKITPDDFLTTAQKNLYEPFSDLPDSDFKRKAIKMVDDLILEHVPDKPMTGNQAMAVISKINDGLFGGGQVVSLTPKQVASMTSQLKGSLKDLLPTELRPFYKQYEMNEIVSRVMEDSEIKRLVGRTILGGVTGGGLAAGGTWQSTKDPVKALINGVIGGVIGAAGLRATGNTALLTTGGKAIKGLATPEAQLIYKSIKNGIITGLNSLSGSADQTK